MRNLKTHTVIFFSLLFLACQKEDFYIARIGTLGDSITKGTPNANYPSELRKLIPPEYQIVNYGVESASLTKKSFKPIWEQDAFHQLIKDEPDIITIMLGTNDCNPRNSDSVRANYENDYREMINLLYNFDSQPRIILCYPPPLYAINEKSDSLVRNEIIPVIHNLGNEYDLQIVDTYFLVDDYPENYTDLLHPDKEGTVTLAEIIADALNL